MHRISWFQLYVCIAIVQHFGAVLDSKTVLMRVVHMCTRLKRAHLKSSAWFFGCLLVAWVLFVSLSCTLFDGKGLWGLAGGREILVLYLFAASDPEYLDNLRFFVHEAANSDQLSDYVIIVKDVNTEEDLDAPASFDLPELPSNARYVQHGSECYDWGTFGWLLNSGQVRVNKYKYFFFINSSVRGPFLPVYARGRVHWTQPFIRRLKGDVKLVGPTISCEGSPLNGDLRGKWRRNPHVQSYAIATDEAGLKVLMKDGGVFHCHSSRWNTIYYSELGSSAAMLAAGYNLDCFMTRYQGVDWRDSANWGCNERLSPQGEHFYDGITLDPLEVMFVKIKSYTLMNGVSSANKAVKYQRWLHPDIWPVSSSGRHSDREGNTVSAGEYGSDGADLEARNPLITSNEYVSDSARFKIPRVLEAKARGPSCFDFDFYQDRNADLRHINSTAILWRHYVYDGQFESRPYRFTCPFDYEQLLSNFA